jgi:predicted MFS family arabinose efflux permease
MQAPRYYEYISEIAPPGQQGLFQGYAFLPIAIALFVGDPFGGWMYENAKKTSNPEIIFFVLFGIGVAATLLMAAYNFVVSKHETKQTIPNA